MKQRSFRELSTDTPDSYPNNAQHELMDAIVHLKSVNECALFFRDLLTMAEITEFTNRWQTVKLLQKGKSYAAIAHELKISTATVTRVAHWLKHGMGGYRLIADRILPMRPDNQPKRHPGHGKRILF